MIYDFCGTNWEQFKQTLQRKLTREQGVEEQVVFLQRICRQTCQSAVLRRWTAGGMEE